MSTPRPILALRREPGPLVRSFAALLLRVALGGILLGSGIQKYTDIQRPAVAASPVVVEEAPQDTSSEPSTPVEGSTPTVADTPRYPESIKGMFAGTILTKEFPWAIDLFLQVLPYAEMGLGAALILGLWTPLAAFFAGILLVKLLLGWVVLGKTDMYPSMLTFLLADVAILWLSPVTSNYISLDGILFGWFWAPRREGTFVEEEATPITPVAPRVDRKR
jgi:uncharacterized membrane protein YphA (DoxX/SURF4 family)